MSKPALVVFFRETINLFDRIDDLSETEAQWMGDALRILRPEILKEPPDNALKLLENGPSAIEDVSRRDSKQFAKDPFGFFA